MSTASGITTWHYKDKNPLFLQRLLDSLWSKILICCYFIVDLFLELSVRQPGLTLFWSVQVSAHFLSKQAWKTVAAGTSLGTHTAQQALQWRKEKKDSLTQQNTIFMMGSHSACCRSRNDQQKTNTSCRCGSFFFADKFRSFSREL